MLDSQRIAFLPRPVALVFITAVAAALAIGFGAAVGNPTPEAQLIVGAVAGTALLATVVARPVFGYWVMTMSTLVLVVYAVTDDRYLSAYDVVLPFAVAATILGRTRAEALAGDALETGPSHEALRTARRAFTRLGLIYYTMATISLVPLAIRIGVPQATESLFGLVRALEGVMIFPLALWWIRDERRLWQTYHAMLAGFGVFTVVNFIHFIDRMWFRAGATWVVNRLDWPLEGANEAGYGMVLLWALVLAKHQVRPKIHDFALLGMIFFMLVLSQSRSSLVAFVILNLFALRKVRLRSIIAGVAMLAIALAFAPGGFWERMIYSLTLKKGSFEVYSAFIRVYGYLTSIQIFLHNWLFGVGYLGGRFVSQSYNSLQITNLGSENFLLETATGLGIFGFAVVAAAWVRLFMLGTAVKRVAPPGTLAYHLARYHVPLYAGLFFISLTGNSFVGNLNIAQNLLWCAILLRSGHIALNQHRASST